MSGRPRVLFLAHTVPYPPDGGVRIRTFHVLRALSRHYDVDALLFERMGRDERGRRFPSRDLGRALGQELGLDAEVFPIPQLHSRMRFILDHASSVLSRRAFTDYLYREPGFERRLLELLHERRHALVHMDSLDLARYLPFTEHLPTVVVHHNVESKLLARRAGAERGVKRWYAALQARRVEELERRWAPRVALNVAVSEEDAAGLLEIAPQGRVAVVPNGVDTEFFRPKGEPGAGLVFAGGLGWFPNLDALRYFAGQILPLIRRAYPQVETTWIGTASAQLRAEFGNRDGLRLTGYVDDIRPLVGAARCYVVPLRVGGGTRLKILDAWAMGVPVVSTRVGCEGLAAEPEQNILMADTPDEFAAAVGRVLSDDGLAGRLASGGRATAERTYSWTVVAREMLSRYDEIVARR